MTYCIKVPWANQKHAQLGDIIINLEDQYDAEMNTYYGRLSVRHANHYNILAGVRFVPIAPFPPGVYEGPVAEVLDCGTKIQHVELASDYEFLSVVTEGTPYKTALQLFGPGAAFDLFNSIHEWGFLRSLHQNPSWYRNGEHFYIDDQRFEDQILGHGSLENYINLAGNVFTSPTFALQSRAENLISELEDIPVGNDGASQQQDAAAFEVWCEKVIAFMLGDGFSPMYLHANKQAFQRRDIVATNLFKSPFGIRIHNGFGVGLLVFEIKNKRNIEKEDIVQVVCYLHEPYGRLGFIIYRSDALVLDPMGAWRFRSIALTQRKHVLELTAGMIIEMLRTYSINGHPEVFDRALRDLLDKYECDYINEPRPSARSGGCSCS